jgi:transposase
VVTDLLDLSGRRILDALVKGRLRPVLAALADGRIHTTVEELTAALYGRVTSHHRFLVNLHLDHIDAIAQAIANINKEVDSQIELFRQPAQMLSAIPGSWAAARTEGSYFQALYHRLRSRRGTKKGIGAVAASLLTIYHMLKNGTLYKDLGANYFDQKAKERQAIRLINRLHILGYQVHIEQKTA